MGRILGFSLLLSCITTSRFVLAQVTNNPGDNVPGVENPGDVTPGVGNSGTSLINPLKDSSIEGFLLSIIDILLKFAVPVIVFFIMYGGFKLVTARGDAHQIESGRTAITAAVIGGVIVLGAQLIISVIKGTITQIQL
jgi:hypothetical protein